MAAITATTTRPGAGAPGRARLIAGAVVFGLMLGFTVTRIGFGDYAELNKMFTFQDWRMFLSFAGGVSLAAAGFFVIGGRRWDQPRIHKGHVIGGVMFGTGWALSGGCPAIPIIQVASGYLPALVTIAGVVCGMLLFRKVNARWLRVDSGSCGL
jgi:hypothetical protein